MASKQVINYMYTVRGISNISAWVAQRSIFIPEMDDFKFDTFCLDSTTKGYRSLILALPHFSSHDHRGFSGKQISSYPLFVLEKTRLSVFSGGFY